MSIFAQYLSLAILLLGLGLMLAEVIVFCYGLFAIGGLLFFSFGLFILVQSGLLSHELAWTLAMTMALSNLGLLAFAGYFAWRARTKQPVTGTAYMLGQTAEVVECLAGNLAWVRLAGELWQASSNEPLVLGNKVQILQVEGLALRVKPL